MIVSSNSVFNQSNQIKKENLKIENILFPAKRHLLFPFTAIPLWPGLPENKISKGDTILANLNRLMTAT